MILHIPHASTNTAGYDINNRCRELLRMTDHFTDELFINEHATSLLFKLSRLICDVERFEDDEQESMSHFGMGVCYTKDSEGELLRESSVTEKNSIINDYYKPHHASLTQAVENELDTKGKALIIDCHSFPDEAYYFNSDFGKSRPDICLGTDEFHTPKALVEKVKVFFLAKGYDVRVDSPYSGTMVPLKHYKKNANVHSIMIELNRKLYMDECGYKTEHYETIQAELTELLATLA
jgi:N-formylglutamate amidohydrolase